MLWVEENVENDIIIRRKFTLILTEDVFIKVFRGNFLDIIKLIATFKEKFGMEISDKDVEKIKTSKNKVYVEEGLWNELLNLKRRHFKPSKLKLRKKRKE